MLRIRYVGHSEPGLAGQCANCYFTTGIELDEDVNLLRPSSPLESHSINSNPDHQLGQTDRERQAGTPAAQDRDPRQPVRTAPAITLMIQNSHTEMYLDMTCCASRVSPSCSTSSWAVSPSPTTSWSSLPMVNFRPSSSRRTYVTTENLAQHE